MAKIIEMPPKSYCMNRSMYGDEDSWTLRSYIKLCDEDRKALEDFNPLLRATLMKEAGVIPVNGTEKFPNPEFPEIKVVGNRMFITQTGGLVQ